MATQHRSNPGSIAPAEPDVLSTRRRPEDRATEVVGRVSWPPRFDLLHVPISHTDYEEAVACILAAAELGQPALVTAFDVHALVTASDDRRYRRMIRDFDLVCPDGQPVRLALNLLHQTDMRDRVYGPKLALLLCQRAAEAGIGIYLYGSTADTVTRMTANLARRYEGLRIAGSESPPFRPLTADEDHAVVERIRRSGARVVLVGLGCPRQDVFAHDHRESIEAVLICVGAAFDLIAGTKRSAPQWMQDNALEWLFRLCQEPRRLLKRYAVCNTKFLIKLAFQAADVVNRRRRAQRRATATRLPPDSDHGKLRADPGRAARGDRRWHDPVETCAAAVQAHRTTHGCAKGKADPAQMPVAGLDAPEALRRPSLLYALVRRGFSGVLRRADAVGRLSLYAGLLLAALSDLRLPGGVGSLADPFFLMGFVCALLVFCTGNIIDIHTFKIHACGLALLSAGIMLSTIVSASNDMGSVISFVKFVFAVTCLGFSYTFLLTERAHIKLALGCWVVSAVLTSIVALLQSSVDGWNIGATVGGRLGGLSQHPNGLGAVTALAMAPGLSLAFVARGFRRLFWMVMVFICITGPIVSASRVGAITAAAMLVVWLFYHLRIDKKMGVLLMRVMTIWGVIMISGHGGSDVNLLIIDRLSLATHPASGSVDFRIYQFGTVLREFSNHPFSGTGLAKGEVAIRGSDVHNMYLMFLRGGGLLALVGIVVVVADLLIKGAWTFGAVGRQESKSIAAAVAAGPAGLALIALSEPLLFHRMQWAPVLLVFAYHATVRRRSVGKTARRGRHQGGVHRSGGERTGVEDRRRGDRRRAGPLGARRALGTAPGSSDAVGPEPRAASPAGAVRARDRRERAGRAAAGAGPMRGKPVCR